MFLVNNFLGRFIEYSCEQLPKTTKGFQSAVVGDRKQNNSAKNLGIFFTIAPFLVPKNKKFLEEFIRLWKTFFHHVHL